MHTQIKTTLSRVLETFEVEVKASIPMSREFLVDMLAVELTKDLTPAPAVSKPKNKPKPKNEDKPAEGQSNLIDMLNNNEVAK